MTTILVHELATKGNELMDRLRAVLTLTPGDAAAALLARARAEPHEKPRMVLTGQFSSGKSSLIKALTDGEVKPVIDADIATDTVTEYPWNGTVMLVDTPGVQSGRLAHDELALGAIGKADFVLFAVTVSLFDDASRDYLRYLAHDLGLFDQMVVVITQAGKQSAAPGVRAKAVQEALGTVIFNLPVVDVDSHFYLRSLEGGPRSELLRSQSGIDALRAEINRISDERGDLARLRQPIHLVRQLCDEAQGLFVRDDQTRDALALLSKQRAAISERRYLIERAFRGAEAEFSSACLTDVAAFVDRVTGVPADEVESVVATAERILLEALERHAGRFADAINLLVQAQLDKFGEQMEEIDEGNRAARLLRGANSINLGAPGSVAVSAPNELGGPIPALNWRKITDQIKDGRAWWGAGDGIRAAAGSNGHQIVKEVGHILGKKFRPWQAVKIANTIGKAAKVGGFVLTFATSTYDVMRNEREAREAQRRREHLHAAFVTEIMGYADQIAAEARTQLWSVVDPPMTALLANAQDAQSALLSTEQFRADAALELDDIASEAIKLLEDRTAPAS